MAFGREKCQPPPAVHDTRIEGTKHIQEEEEGEEEDEEEEEHEEEEEASSPHADSAALLAATLHGTHSS